MQLPAGADPVAALDAFVRQQRHQTGIGTGHVARQHGNPQARAGRLLLGDHAGAVKHHLRVAAEAVEEHQFLAEQQVVDIANPGMPPQVLATAQRR
ncbi:hypothetical protein D3C72_2045630 [compost metagenome]